MADGDLDLDEPTAAVRRPPAGADWRALVTDLLGDRRRAAGVFAAGLLVVGAAVAGYVLLRTPAPPPTESQLPYAGASVPGVPADAGTATTATTEAAELVVHAAGAVVVPGLHRVPSGARVADLLTAAGGPTPDADLDRVNLAASLADGERVWFPRVGEVTPPPVAGAPSGSGGANGPDGPGGTGTDGPVDVNTATAEELDALPGIGPAIAAAIVEHRERHGPFASVDALLDVPGIGDAKLAQLRDLVTV